MADGLPAGLRRVGGDRRDSVSTAVPIHLTMSTHIQSTGGCSMNRGPTIFLRVVISLIAIAAPAVCIFPLPRMIAKEAAKTPDTAWQIYLFLVGAYLQAALFL